MFKAPFDMITIGDITTDAFIRLKEASIHCNIDRQNCELCMRFGEKIPFEYVKVIKAAGNAANSAVCASRLGLRTAIISNVGNDQNGKETMNVLQDEKIVTSLIRSHKDKLTNYHFVLWYESDMTILVNHIDYDYRLPEIPKTKWIYLTSLPSGTFSYHMNIIEYLDTHPEVKLAFKPGTFQISLGMDELKRLYARADVCIVNLEEAKKIMRTDTRDPKSLLLGIHRHGPKIAIITNGIEGAYMYYGDHYYFMPIYPNPRPAVERTGCGDSFASTFLSALIMGKTPLEALVFAPINPMSVAQFVGSREGLLTLEQLEWWLKRAPEEFKPREI